MATRIAQRELRNDNAKVIERVIAGETFVVTRNGIPVAQVQPVRETRSHFVSRDELLAFVGVGPDIEFRSFRDDLDSLIDPDL